MAWDSGFKSPADREKEQLAALEARQRASLQPFERRLLDVLGEIANSLRVISCQMSPAYEIDAETGEIHRFNETNAAGPDAGDVSAEPVDDPDPRPGSARPADGGDQ